MPIPDEVLDYLAERYFWACIDHTKLPFAQWAAMEAEKMGWRI